MARYIVAPCSFRAFDRLWPRVGSSALFCVLSALPLRFKPTFPPARLVVFDVGWFREFGSCCQAASTCAGVRYSYQGCPRPSARSGLAPPVGARGAKSAIPSIARCKFGGLKFANSNLVATWAPFAVGLRSLPLSSAGGGRVGALVGPVSQMPRARWAG